MKPDDLTSRRRALAKQHHPDRGGDPEAFVRAMRSLETPSTPRHDIVIVASTRTRVRRTVATTRSTITTQARRLARLARHPRRTP